MGDFTDGNRQQELVATDHEVRISDKDQSTSAPDGKFKTDVDGVYADGEKQGFPVFDIDPDEFFKNMKADRRRLRFKSDSAAASYHRNTKYRRPFWVRNSKDGYTYKIK